MEYNKVELSKQIEKVLAYSQGYDIDMLNCNPLIDTWEKNKARLYKQFDNNLIVFTDKEIFVNMVHSEKHKCFDNFIRDLQSAFAGLTTKAFLNYLKDNEDGFFNNEVIRPPDNMPDIKTGMKLLKSFKYFYDEPVLHGIQDLASTYIQKNKISGYLYLSIHPMSYLTISENNCNWRSCHALDGEYRSGNLNYMLDDVTVVAGLVSSKDMVHLKSFPNNMKWLNNKWRMLVHIHPQDRVIYYNKQYPYSSIELLDQTCFLLQEFFPNAGWSYPEPDSLINITLADGTQRHLDHSYLLINDCFVKGNKVIKTNENNLFFNDLLDSSTYSPWISYGRILHEEGFFYPKKMTAWHKDLIKIRIGEDAPCVCCGNTLKRANDGFVCGSCEQEMRIKEHDQCAYCGRRFYDEDEDMVQYGDELFCEDCYQEVLKYERIFSSAVNDEISF